MLPRWLLFPLLPFALICSAESCGGEQPRPPKGTPDRAQIEHLIEQLSSPEFNEREAASRGLEKIGPPAMGALREATVRSKDAEVRRRAADIAAAIENTPEQLLIDYRAFGLPLPPKDAKLVRFDSGVTGGPGGPGQRKLYGLAFQLKAATRKEGPVLLQGPDQWKPGWVRQTEDFDPRSEAVKDLWPGLHGLGLAIQCYERGWDGLARHLLEQSRTKDGVPPRLGLCRMAWDYWEVRLNEPKVDRGLIAKRLKELLARDKDLDTEHNRVLLKCLDLALVPSKAKPGSVGALIDALVDCTSTVADPGGFPPDDCYWRVVALGFDAVPALIEHLDDDRLTRAVMGGFNNFRSWNMRVGDLAGDLLEGLAGRDIGRDWVRRLQGHRVEKAAARKWWDEARKVGEEKYLLDRVLPPAGKRDDAAVSVLHLRVLAAKYPRDVLDIYRTVLDKRPQVDSRVLAAAIPRCKLPDKDKLEILLRAAKHGERAHRYPALDALKELDRKEFNTLLIEGLEKVPADLPGDERYDWCDEGIMARFAHESDDSRVWQTLEKAIKRSAVGLRMEMLDARLDYPGTTFQRRELLRHFLRFLDDAALRDTGSSVRYGGDCAAHIYRKLEVRNFVALQLTSLLDIEIDFNPGRTPEEWAKLRGQIREAAERELGKMKK
jgi:HEAT repeat protein